MGHPHHDESTPRTNRRFTLFPQLPMEIRFKIWKEAQPLPRGIGLTIPNRDPNDGFSNATQPTLLSVCQESRSETLKIYKPVSHSMKSNGSSSRRPIYIDPENELLHLADDWATFINQPDTAISLDAIIPWLNKDLYGSLRYLGIGLFLFDTWTSTPSTKAALLPLSELSALKGIFVVLSPESTQKQENVDLVSPYNFQLRKPPLLASDEAVEDSLYFTYIPEHVRYVQQAALSDNPAFDELDELLTLPAGADRMAAIDEAIADLHYEVYRVSEECTEWKLPAVGIGSLRVSPDQQGRETPKDEWNI
ncbi:uncharacterized protein RSE6_12897 [Rhynchosporium secalis]|uniref:2EXR domain-containing protein n=1 Tax=Rhynchosporium secalis TaxID=38038 RepID=A0A1E1MRN5_RHYSE|nr:uncharacterized protein RSE6_12897 [Rhynchosporium secalis]